MTSDENNKRVREIVQRLTAELGDARTRRATADLTKLAMLAMGLEPQEDEEPPAATSIGNPSQPTTERDARAQNLHPVRSQKGENHTAGSYVPSGYSALNLPGIGGVLAHVATPDESAVRVTMVRPEDGAPPWSDRCEVIEQFEWRGSEAAGRALFDAAYEAAWGHRPDEPWWIGELEALLAACRDGSRADALGLVRTPFQRVRTGSEILETLRAEGTEEGLQTLPAWLTAECIDDMIARLIGARGGRQARTVVLAELKKHP